MPAIPEFIKTNIVIKPTANNLEAMKDLIAITDSKKVIWCGGVVIAQYLADGEMKETHPLGENDLDILIPTINDILVKGLLDKFEVTHIHDYSKKEGDYHHNDTPHDDFFVGLKHKSTGVKIHCYDYKPFLPMVINIAKLESDSGTEIYLRSAEDQCITKLLEIIRVRGTSLWEAKFGPILNLKYVFELIALLKVCDPFRIQHLWHYHPTRRANAYGQMFYEELGKTIAYILENPTLLAKTNPKPNTQPVVAGEEKQNCLECIFDYPEYPISN